MTKFQKRRAAVERRRAFTKEWLEVQPDGDIAILAALAHTRLGFVRKPLSDEEAGRIRRILEESKRRELATAL